jgi:hypothetical protein
MTHRGPANPERSFGISVGMVLCVIAALLLWRGRIGRAEVVGAVGIVLLVFGLVYPPLLTYPSAAWWRFSRALGYVNARILLSIIFPGSDAPRPVVAYDRQGSAGGHKRWRGWTPCPVTKARSISIACFEVKP